MIHNIYLQPVYHFDANWLGKGFYLFPFSLVLALDKQGQLLTLTCFLTDKPLKFGWN